MKKKLVSLALVVILIVNLILFGMGAINNMFFWMVIIVIAFISYFMFSKGKDLIRKTSEKE